MIPIGLWTVGESRPSDSLCCDYAHHPSNHNWCNETFTDILTPCCDLYQSTLSMTNATALWLKWQWKFIVLLEFGYEGTIMIMTNWQPQISLPVYILWIACSIHIACLYTVASSEICRYVVWGHAPSLMMSTADVIEGVWVLSFLLSLQIAKHTSLTI